jgi:hypothetical protein
MMTPRRTISDRRRRQLFLEAALRERRQGLVRSAGTAVRPFKTGGGDLSATSVQGLVNALGAGPGRRRPGERLDSLKRYLAWRRHRAGEDDPWTTLADRIARDLTRLEAELQEMHDRINEERALPPLEPADRAALLQEMHVRLAEVYLDALASYYEMGEVLT